MIIIRLLSIAISFTTFTLMNCFWWTSGSDRIGWVFLVITVIMAVTPEVLCRIRNRYNASDWDEYKKYNKGEI